MSRSHYRNLSGNVLVSEDFYFYFVRPQYCLLHIVSLLGHSVQSSVFIRMPVMFCDVFTLTSFLWSMYAFTSTMQWTEWSGVVVCSIVCADLGVRTVSEPQRLCGFKRGDDILLICVWKIPAILETVFNEKTIQNLCHVVCHVERHTQANFDSLHMYYCRNKPSTDVYSFIVDVLSCQNSLICFAHFWNRINMLNFLY